MQPDRPGRRVGAGNAQGRPGQASSPIKSWTSAQQRHNLLLDLPIAWRLALGFVLAALIAASASAFSGIQRAQSLHREADFYQSLLTTNTNLNNGGSFLQLMNAETQSMLIDASAPDPSAETLKQDEGAINNLITLYDNVTKDYLKNRQLYQHPDQTSLLTETGRGSLVTQQRILGASMSRTWQVYRAALGQVLSEIAADDVATAQIRVRAQAEPTNTDALSALRAVIQFDGRLAGSVHEAADLDQRDQALTTVGVAFVAFLLIVLVGWVISNTLVRRLRMLGKVADSVEQGEVAARAVVIGTDEIARVSSSVNGMLDTIVGLLDVTRRQRDALNNAAARLFADVRIAGTGDLRVNASVGSDPIGMLANAFNFTVNRFRRFVMRTRFSMDQLDMNSRQAMQRAETFLIANQALMRGQNNAHHALPYSSRLSSVRESSGHMPMENHSLERPVDISHYIIQARDLMGRLAREGVNHHSRVVLDLAEQAYLSAGRLSQLAMTAYNIGTPGATAEITNALMEELRALGVVLARLGTEANAIQKSTTASLSELDSTLAAISEAWTVPIAPASVQPGEAQQMAGGYSIDVLRISNEFAEEVVLLARQSMTLTREMRAHIEPFRLDQSQNSDMDLPMYTPGTR